MSGECADCGAGPEQPCDPACPSGVTAYADHLTDELDNYEPPCCPRGALCACRIGEPQ